MVAEKIDRARLVLDRLRSEWNEGYAHWAMFLEGNGRDQTHRARLHDAINAASVQGGFSLVLSASTVVALMALARITDKGTGRDVNSLGVLNGLIASEEARAALIQEAGEWYAGIGPDLETPFRSAENRELVDTLSKQVRKAMNKFNSGRVASLIQGVRDSRISHALDLSREPVVQHDLSEAFDDAGRIIAALSLVVSGTNIDIEGMKRLHDKTASEWWDRILAPG